MIRPASFGVAARPGARRLVLPAVLAAGTFAVASAPASAGTVSISGSDLSFAAPGPERNQIRTGTTAPDPAFGRDAWTASLTDDGSPVVLGAGCVTGLLQNADCVAPGPPSFRIDVGDGDDTVEAYNDGASTGAAILRGGAGSDKLASLGLRADLDGGPGNDTLLPDDSPTSGVVPPTPGGVVRGGAGTDTVSYTMSPPRGGLRVSLDGRADDGTADEKDDVGTDVENVVGSFFNDNALIGSAVANRLEGGPGEDRIVGGPGRDVLVGASGADTLDALDGISGDRVECGDGADVALVDAGDVVASQDVMGGTPCEKVVYAAGVPSSVRFRSKRISVPVSCPKVSTATCSGAVRLTSTAGKRLGSGSYRVKPGKKRSVSLRVSKKPARKAALIVAPKGSTPVAGRAVTVR